jgi:hypothetical protein
MATQAKIIEGVKEVIQDTTFTSARILDYLNQGTRQIAGGILLQYPDRTQLISSPLPLLQTNSSLTTSITLPYISMPSDYGRVLFALVSSTNELAIEVVGGLPELLSYYENLDNTGRVTMAAIRGDRLYYQGYPTSAETLVAYYHRDPHDMATLTGGTDISFATNTVSDAGNGLGVFKVGQTIDVTSTSNNNTSLTVSSVATTGATMVVDEDLTTEANTSATLKSRPDGIPSHLHESLLENYAAWKIFERKSRAEKPTDIDAKRYYGLFMSAMLDLEASIETIPEPIQFKSERY